jgi:hypothetical protein
MLISGAAPLWRHYDAPDPGSRCVNEISLNYARTPALRRRHVSTTRWPALSAARLALSYCDDAVAHIKRRWQRGAALDHFR